jgi:hypothetical protein
MPFTPGAPALPNRDCHGPTTVALSPPVPTPGPTRPIVSPPEVQGWPPVRSQAACAPSQNGLLAELPHRHNVSRFRISYVFPSAETTGTPPRTQIGPPTFFSVSSIRPSDGVNFGSMAFPVRLSQITNRPAGQCAASCFTIFRASAVSRLTRFQILPFGSQKRANAHRFYIITDLPWHQC